MDTETANSNSPPSPTGPDIDALLASLTSRSVPGDDYAQAKQLLEGAMQLPEGLQKVLEAWMTADLVRMEDMDDPLSVLNAVVRQTAPQHAEALCALLSSSLAKPAQRLRTISLLAAIFRSRATLPRATLNPVIVLLLSSCLVDTDAELVHASSETFSVGLLRILTDSTGDALSEQDESELLGLSLACVGRAITWGWNGRAERDAVAGESGTRSGGVDEDEDGKGGALPMDAAAPLRPQLGYERAGPSTATSEAPDLFTLLTVLYGLYPANVMTFAESPLRWLARRPEAACPYLSGWPVCLDEKRIRRQAPNILRSFRFNPSLITHSDSSELQDRRRWYGLEKEILFNRCLALQIDGSAPFQRNLLQSATGQESNVVQRLRDELEMQVWIADSALRSAERAQMAADIQRGGEEERQSLHFRVKELRTLLEKEQVETGHLRRQAEYAKKQASEWVASLQEKLRSFRDEKRSWATEAVELRSEMAEAKNTLRAQQQILEKTAAELFKLKAQRIEDTPKVERVANFERRIDQLKAAEKLWAEDVRRYQEQKAQMDLMKSNWKKMELQLEAEQAQSKTLAELNKQQQREIADLQKRLAAQEQMQKPTRLSQSLVEQTERLRAVIEDLQKELPAERERARSLLDDNADLRAQIEDLQAELVRLQTSPPPRTQPGAERVADTPGGSQSRRGSTTTASSDAPEASHALVSVPILGIPNSPIPPSPSMISLRPNFTPASALPPVLTLLSATTDKGSPSRFPDRGPERDRRG